jgi:tetratricopeptide (TPR) repeat protein
MKVLLSCVSSEFRSYRQHLAAQLAALPKRGFEVKVQEEFQQGGFTLLDQLGAYIRECDLVIHLVGDACGARPTAEHVRTMFAHLGVPAPEPLPERSYTQWEYDLAIRFDRRVLCYFVKADAARDCGPMLTQTDEEAGLQAEHRTRIESSGKHYSSFSSHADLVRLVFHDLGLSPEDKVNNLPFPSIGSLFKGRDEFLVKLRQTLGEVEHRGLRRAAAITAAPAAALYGLGGIGKTRAAIEYAHRYADEYTALLFVVADSPASLKQNLASLCGAAVLNLAEKDERETAVQVAAVTRWLRRNPGWFLILDNVDSEEAVGAVEELLGTLTGSGQVVITSRIARWGGEVEPLDLDVLDEASSVAYLSESTARERRLEPDDEPLAHTLALELGQLALALEQAAAYINAEACSFAQYLVAWSRRRDELLNSHDPLVTHYPRSVAITWLTSFQQLTEHGRRLLRILSWLAPDPIPRSLMEAEGGPFAGHSEQERPPEECNELVRKGEKALANLRRYSLAILSADKLSFLVHRLVQDVTRRTLPEVEKVPCLKQALRWVNDAFKGDPTDVRNWPVLEPLTPHVRAIVTFADQQITLDPSSHLVMQIGLLFNQKAQFAESEPLLRRALAIAERTSGFDSLDAAECLNGLALLMMETNVLDEAERLFRRALDIYKARLGPEDRDVADVMNNLGLVLQATGRLDDAERLLRLSLKFFEGARGPSHTDVATALNNLAQLLIELGKFGEAEPLIRRALEIDENEYGSDHPGVAVDLNSLGRILEETNRFDEAELLFRHAFEIDEKVYGPDHPTVAVDLSSLASVLATLGRIAEAEPLYRRALAIDEKTYAPTHPEISNDLRNLASLLQEAGRLVEAEPLFRRAFEIGENAVGRDHPAVATDLSNLGWMAWERNRFAEAERLFRRALEIDVNAYDQENPEIARDLNLLGSLLQQVDRFAEAEPLLRRALDIDEKAYGSQHPEIVKDLGALGWFLQQTNRLAEAAPLLRRALDIDEQIFGRGNPRVASSLNNLALILQETNQMSEAEFLFREALGMEESARGIDQQEVAMSLNNLGWLLVETSRLAEAEPLFRRALTIYETERGAEYFEVAVSLDNLGSVMLETDRLDKAELLMRRALAINEKAFGQEHSSVAASGNYLGELFARKGQFAEAEALVIRALTIREGVFGKVHPEVAASLNTLGSLMQKMTRIEESELIFRRSCAIYEGSYGPDHPKVAMSLNGLGLALWQLKGPMAAEMIFRRACEILTRSLNDNGHKPLGAGRIMSNYRALLEDLGSSFKGELPAGL